MTATTQTRMNVVLALAVPAAGLAYLTGGDSLTSGGFPLAAMVALGVLWLTTAAAVNTLPHPRRDVVSRVKDVAEGTPSRRVLTPAYSAYINVSRADTPWRWKGVLLAPVELLILGWSIPVLVLLVMVPLGLALASAVWAGRLILRS